MGSCNQQQPTPLLFTSRWIPDQTNTSINIQNSNNVRISVESNESIYNTPGRKGTSPMIILSPVQGQQQCISGRLKLTVSKYATGGLILMDNDYNPIFECGIGNQQFTQQTIKRVDISDIISSSSPVFIDVPDENSITEYVSTGRITIFEPYYSEDESSPSSSANYVSENIDPNDYINFRLVIDRNVGIIQFYDGLKTHGVTTNFTVDYIGIYIKGEGQSTLELDNLIYSGFEDAPVPAVSQLNPDEYTIIKNMAMDSPGSELFSGTASLEACSNLCEMNNLQCAAFEFDSSINMCTIKTHIDTEKFYNKKIPYSSVPSPSAVQITSNVYIKATNLPTISYFYIFKDSNDENTSISLTPNLEIVNLCIDNTYSNDFMALDVDKIRVHSGIFEYDFFQNTDNTKGSLVLKFITRENEIFYITSINSSYFREIKFIDSTKTNIIEDSKKAVVLDLNLRDDFGIKITSPSSPSSFTSSFDCISIAPASSTARFIRNKSNSFTLSSTGVLTEYINNGVTIKSNNNTITSKSKIILKKNPLTALIICSDKLLFLLNDNSIFSDLSAGYVFSNYNQYPDSMPLAYELTLSTPLFPSYTVPFSQTFPEKFLTGEYTFFYTTTETTYIIRFVDGFVDYSAFGYTSRYVTRIIRNDSSSIRGVIFTDKSGITHFIYIDGLNQYMYDKISESFEFGPFSKTYPMHNIGDLFLKVQPPGPGVSFRFLCATYDTFWVHAYQNPTSEDIFFLESENNSLNPGAKIGEIKIESPTIFSNEKIELMTPTNFICTTTTTGTTLYTGDIINQSLQGFSINYPQGSTININQTTRLLFNTSKYNFFYIEDNNRYLSYVIEFSSTTNTLNIYNPCTYDELLNKSITVSTTGTYTYSLSMENFYDTNITVTINNNNENYIYSNDKPHILTRRSDGQILKRTIYTINTIIPDIKRIGYINITGFTSDTIELTVSGSTLSIGDRIDFGVVCFSDMTSALSLSNPPTEWNGTGVYTLTLSSPILRYGVYIVRIFSRGTFVIDSTGGYFNVIDDTPIANQNMTFDSISI